MPRVTFSATVNTGTSMKCWCTIPMPAAMRRTTALLPHFRPRCRRQLHRALGGYLDRAVHDARLHLRHLVLQRGRDLTVEVVERGERDAAVGQRADVVTALERAIGRAC